MTVDSPRTPVLDSSSLPPVPRWTETRIALAGLAGWVAFFAPTQVLLAVATERMYPADKELAFGVVSAVGSVVMLLAYPLIGMLSDRLLSRVDRRTVSMIGVLVAGVGLVSTGQASSGVALGVFWAATQIGIAAIQCGVETTVADRIPSEHRARIGGKLAAAQMFAALLGTVVASVTTDLPLAYVVVVAVVALLAAPFIAFGGAPVPAAPAAPTVAVAPVRGDASDLWLGWISRALVLFGLGNVTQFLYFFVHDELDRPDPASALIHLTGLFVLSVVVSALLCGKLSDRLDDRTGPAVVGAIVAGLAASTFGLTESWPLILVAAVLFGTGLGAFMGPSFALITELLPDPKSHGRDLGLLNSAVVAPGALAPVVGILVLGGDHGYTILYGIAGGSLLLGGSVMYLLRQRHRTAAIPR